MTHYGTITPSNSLAFAAVAGNRSAAQDAADRQQVEEFRTVIISAPVTPPATTQVLKLEIDPSKLPASR